MGKEIYQKLLDCIENLETSLDLEEWIYIHDDLLSLREVCQEFNNLDSEFYQFKYKSLHKQISFLELESKEFLKKYNIIV